MIPHNDDIDRKDLQLLELLAQNCRLSLVTMGKALKLSKDAVSYRLNNLEKNGWLSQFTLFVDARRMGFTRYHILIRFEATYLERKDLPRKFKENKSVMWINTFIGRYDMQVIVDAVDAFHLNAIKEDLFARCRNRVKEYTILTHLSDLEFTQLNPILNRGTEFIKANDTSFSRELTTKRFPVDPDFDGYTPKPLEVELLRQLADNPRATLVDLSGALGCDRQTVRVHILNLIKKKIVISFSAIPSLSKLGFVTYYLLVRVKQDATLRDLRKPFLKLRNIFYAGRMLGDSDLILYLNARTPEELHQSIENFQADLGSHILHHELLVQDQVHFWRQYTDGIYEVLKRRSGQKITF